MPSLPFGTTDVTRNAVVESLDLDRAERKLRTGAVENPQTGIENFVSDLPALLDWLQTSGREFPWRNTSNPWRVYISEILLQRTRADAVASIYDEFFSKYPDSEAVDAASEDEIRETISSLGFGNQRTRTLKESAEIFVDEFDASIPRSVEALKSPWRVGDYSARATVLFAFERPQPLVDANIARIIERYFAYSMPRQPHKDSQVYDLMEALTPSDPGLARAFYLSLIDLGALVCTPENPACADCPLREHCQYRIDSNMPI